MYSLVRRMKRSFRTAGQGHVYQGQYYGELLASKDKVIDYLPISTIICTKLQLREYHYNYVHLITNEMRVITNFVVLLTLVSHWEQHERFIITVM